MYGYSIFTNHTAPSYFARPRSTLSFYVIPQTLCEALVIQGIHIAQSLLIPQRCIHETSPHNYLIEAVYLAKLVRDTRP